MTITNGYATLDELKARLLEMRSYTASTISFDNATATITDAAKGFRGVAAANVIEIEGSAFNDGYYTVESVTAPDSIVVTGTLAGESAGASVTIRLAGDVFDDDTLEQVIEAASRWIDAHTGRRFYAATETRYYTAGVSDWLAVDDLLSVDSLKTDSGGGRTYSTTWATTDYDLFPLNATPSTMIATAPAGTQSFPMLARSVQITGSFGYSSTAPAQVREACLLMSARLFKRKDAPFGIAGFPALGEVRNIRPEDGDVLALLRGLRRII